eukprot:UN10906
MYFAPIVKTWKVGSNDKTELSICERAPHIFQGMDYVCKSLCWCNDSNNKSTELTTHPQPQSHWSKI